MPFHSPETISTHMQTFKIFKHILTLADYVASFQVVYTHAKSLRMALKTSDGSFWLTSQ
mgnify:CR=1 FL=1